ncbi:hypothetical protein AHV57_00740 [Salmonella enterica]|nr:hypothetical protein [Salmonella enterica]
MNISIEKVLLARTIAKKRQFENTVENFKCINFPRILKPNTRHSGKAGEVMGVVSHIELSDVGGITELRGTLNFNECYEWEDIIAILREFPYPFATIRNAQGRASCEILHEVTFVSSCESDIPLDYVNWRNCVCHGREEYAEQALRAKVFKNTSVTQTISTSCEARKESVITFGNKGQDIGNGIMRHGYYYNGALMGYVVFGLTEFCGDHRPRHSLDILEKFVEHQCKKWGEATNRWSFDDIKKPQATRLVSSFIPAINAYGKDEKSIDLIHRIITVVGASKNCRQDEIEAAYKISLEELIDRLVRDWHAAFQPSS